MKNVSAYSNIKNITTIGNVEMGHHYWVGHVAKDRQYFAGQTFRASKTGDLKSISIYPEIIVRETEAVISLFEFDASTREWKEMIGEVSMIINNDMEKKWVSFELENIKIDSGKQYAFKLTCNNNGMMAIAESYWKDRNLYKDGEQWTGCSENPNGRFHKEFDFSFIATVEN